MLDPRWQRRRLEIMQRADFKCEACADGESTLNVHHVRYKRDVKPWEYTDKELICLCQDCHGERHERTNDLIDMLASAHPMELNMDEAISFLAGYLSAQAFDKDRSEEFKKFSMPYENFPSNCQCFETARHATVKLFERRAAVDAPKKARS